MKKESAIEILEEKLKELKREIEICQKREKEVRLMLSKIVSRVAENEEISRKIDEIEESIYKETNLEGLLRTFVFEIKRIFKIPVLRLALIENSQFVEMITKKTSFELLGKICQFIDVENLTTILEGQGMPILDNKLLEVYSPAFSDEEMREIFSIAIVPIFSSDKLIGAVCFGDSDINRYSKDKDTSLIAKLGRKFSICLDNVIKTEQLRELSVNDNLTELLNRDGMKRALKRKIEESKRFNQNLTLIFIDLDKFKAINDNFGHITGDKALQHFANRLRSVARGVDVLCRMGGDEFLIILPGTDEQQAKKFVDRLKNDLKRNLFCCSKEIKREIFFSAGVSLIFPNIETPNVEEIIKKADEAMYRQKNKKNDK